MILVSTVLLLSACSFVGKPANDEQQFSVNDAIAKVVHEKFVHENENGFPTEAKRIKGTIHGGGPAPGITIPGEFESSAIKKKDVFIVTLTEYWQAKDFRDSEKKEGTLSAYWTHMIRFPFLKSAGKPLSVLIRTDTGRSRTVISRHQVQELSCQEFIITVSYS
jgi:hypothetical protein